MIDIVSEQNILDRLRQGSATAAFNCLIGLEVIAANQGNALIALPWRDEFGQYRGFLHAALIAGLIDTSCGFAASTLAPSGVLASHFSVNCLAPGLGRRFLAHGRVVKAGRRQIFTASELYAEKDDGVTLIATGEAILVPVE